MHVVDIQIEMVPIILQVIQKVGDFLLVEVVVLVLLYLQLGLHHEIILPDMEIYVHVIVILHGKKTLINDVE